MLRISKEQKDSFEARAAELFPDRLQVLLLDKLPEQEGVLAGPSGRELVAQRIDTARERGFVGERDAAQFVALGFVLGEGFPEEPWAKAVLEDASFETPTDRIEALWRAAEHRALDEAAGSTARAMGASGAKR
jgi:hypothetical protein